MYKQECNWCAWLAYKDNKHPSKISLIGFGDVGGRGLVHFFLIYSALNDYRVLSYAIAVIVIFPPIRVLSQLPMEANVNDNRE